MSSNKKRHQHDIYVSPVFKIMYFAFSLIVGFLMYSKVI